MGTSFRYFLVFHAYVFIIFPILTTAALEYLWDNHTSLLMLQNIQVICASRSLHMTENPFPHDLFWGCGELWNKKTLRAAAFARNMLSSQHHCNT